jgi:putative nucleotide binding protein
MDHADGDGTPEDDRNGGDAAADDEEEAGDADAAADDGGDGPTAVLLDVLPNGRPDDDRPRSKVSPVAYGLGADSFALYELMLADDADVSVGARVDLDGPSVGRYREVSFDDLTRNAAAEIEYAAEAIVDADEERFVDFYNEAGPITLRLHQLNLLPGIGKKLRNDLLDERKRGPFESFADVEERISGLHRPREVILERIVEEIREDDLKYQTFVGREE